LTLNDSTTIDVAAASTLRITQQTTVAPAIAVTKIGAGTLAMKNVRADGLLIGAGTLQIVPAGAAAGTSIAKALTIAPAATLDLNNNDLLIDYTGGTPYATIRNYLLAGGIVSTTGQAAGNTIHAIIDNVLHKTTWNGLPIDDTTIIAKYTLKGDANLDGTVGFADLIAVAQHYGNNTGQATWDIGDFNYNGNVGFADLVTLAQNYGSALPTDPIAGTSETLAKDLQTAFATVPEPSVSIWITVMYGLTYSIRRRRLPQPQRRD